MDGLGTAYYTLISVKFSIFATFGNIYELCNAHLVMQNAGEVTYLPKDAALPITLKTREYEVFTVVPVKELSNGVKFAPIGLVKMFNSGGAVKELRYESEKEAVFDMKVRGCGLFGAYSSIRPKRISVNMEEVGFEYKEDCGLVTIELGVPEKELYLWNIIVEI